MLIYFQRLPLYDNNPFSDSDYDFKYYHNIRIFKMSSAPKVAKQRSEPSWMLFKVKNPIEKFKEVFIKEVD